MTILEGEDFGAYLVRHREALGLTQLSLAEMLGISQAAVGQWERGDTIPRPSKFPALAAALGVPNADLLVVRRVSISKLMPSARGVRESQQETEASLQAEGILLEANPAGMTGMGLLAQVVVALERGLLQPHQISMLGSLIQTFQRDSALTRIAASED